MKYKKHKKTSKLNKLCISQILAQREESDSSYVTDSSCSSLNVSMACRLESPQNDSVSVNSSISTAGESDSGQETSSTYLSTSSGTVSPRKLSFSVQNRTSDDLSEYSSRNSYIRTRTTGLYNLGMLQSTRPARLVGNGSLDSTPVSSAQDYSNMERSPLAGGISSCCTVPFSNRDVSKTESLQHCSEVNSLIRSPITDNCNHKRPQFSMEKAPVNYVNDQNSNQVRFNNNGNSNTSCRESTEDSSNKTGHLLNHQGFSNKEQKLMLIKQLICIENSQSLLFYNFPLQDQQNLPKAVLKLTNEMVQLLVRWTNQLPFTKRIPISVYTHIINSKWQDVLVLMTSMQNVLKYGRRQHQNENLQQQTRNNLECIRLYLGERLTNSGAWKNVCGDIREMIEQLTLVRRSIISLGITKQEYVCLKVILLLNQGIMYNFSIN